MDSNDSNMNQLPYSSRSLSSSSTSKRITPYYSQTLRSPEINIKKKINKSASTIDDIHSPSLSNSKSQKKPSFTFA